MDISPTDLSKTPAATPPPGYASNLVDPPSKAYQMTICNIVCACIVLFFVSLRLYTRTRIVNYMGPDDCSCSLRPPRWLLVH